MTDKNESNAINIDDPRLTAFVLGELDATETNKIEAAISGSPELAAAVAEIRQTVELLGSAYGTEEPVRLLDEQRAALAVAGASDSFAAGIETSTNGSVGIAKKDVAQAKASSSRRPWLPIAIAASLLGLMLGGAWYVNEFGAPPMAKHVADAVNSQAKESANAPEAKMTAEAIELKQEILVDVQAEPIVSDRLSPVDVDKAVAEKVEEFNRLVEEERYSEARVVARAAREFAPDHEVTQLLNAKSKLLSRVKKMDELQSNTEYSFWSGIHESKQAPVPHSSPESALADVELVPPSKEEEGAVEDFMSDSSSQSRGLVLSEEDRMKIARSHSNMQPTDNLAATPDAEVESFDMEEETEELDLGAAMGRGGMGGGAMGGRGGMEGGLGGGMGGMGGGAGGGMRGQSADNQSRQGDSVSESIESESIESDDAFMPASEEWKQKRLRRSKFAETRSPADAPARNRQPNQSGEQGESNGDDKAPRQQFDDDKSQRQDRDLANTENGGEESQPGNDVRELLSEKREDGKLAQKAKLEKGSLIKAELKELEALGIRAETRMVQQTKTRTVPVQQTRKESRTRNVVIDGKSVQQRYEVEVPFTENVTQSYSVQVPQTIFTFEKGKSRELVERLAKRVDPTGTKTLELPQLLELVANESKDESDASEIEPDGVEQLAVRLNETLKGSEEKDVVAGKVIEELTRSLQRRNAEVRKNRSWKRVKAIPNTTRLMVGDKDELDMNGMQVKVQVDGFRARVLIDCFYYNDRAQQLEGNFKLRLPDDASLYYFAFGESVHNFNPKGVIAQEEFLDDGTQFVSLGAPGIKKAREDVWANVKESRMVPKEKAAHAFRETVRRKVDPALVEWSGAGVFNARVFPLAPHKLHRIVIGYDVNLKKENDDLVYELALPEQAGQCQVDINVQTVDGVNYEMTPQSDPFQDAVAGKTLRRYRFVGPQPNGIRLKATPSDAANAKPILVHCSNQEEGKFWGVQVTPELPVEQVQGSPQAIFMLDTSLSSNPDKFNVWLKMLETTLNSNRDSLQQFNVMFFNVDAHLWQDKWVDNTPENVESVLNKCNTLALEGATDLYGAIEHLKSQKWLNNETIDVKTGVTPSPDLFLLSDGAANWGETNLRLIGRQLEQSNLGSMFAYQSGLTGTAIANLRFLAGETGGAVFSVATEAEIKTAAKAHRKRPWKLDSLVAAGASDLMTAGRVKWVYPGQTITVVGRGEVTDEIKLSLTQGTSEKIVSVSPTKVESELASRLYGQVAVGQLESLGAKVFDVAASYARHFRVTGDTCSLLMLESEADYQRFDIKPEEDLFVIKTKAAKDLVADTLKKSFAELADPKAQLQAWLARLENMPGMEFKMPTALGLAMEGIEINAISKPLDCQLTSQDGLSKDYLAHLNQERLDYDLIAAEANRRGGSSVDEAIKVFSSLVERNPGNLEISRDVAFTAMEMGRPAQAFHLLRNVAQARPFEGSIYPALGQCLSQLGQADQAIVYYEIALGGSFRRCGASFKDIVSAEYSYLLRRVESGELKSSIPQFAKARLETLNKEMRFKEANLVITMLWNTDQTDVDLHVTEPSGEECSYENKKTRSGGRITEDITTGFGPEMYSNTNAPGGKYDIKVKYFSNRQNRTELRNKVHLMIYRGFGTDKEQLTRRTVQLKTVGNKESVATIGVDK